MSEQPGAVNDGRKLLKQTGRLQRHLLQIATVVGVSSAVAMSGNHFRSSLQPYEGTEYARIDAVTTSITASISGTVVSVYVEPYQRVKAGQLLAQLDPRDSQIAVELARAQISQAEAKCALSRQQYSLLSTKIDEAHARDTEAGGINSAI